MFVPVTRVAFTLIFCFVRFYQNDRLMLYVHVHVYLYLLIKSVFRTINLMNLNINVLINPGWWQQCNVCQCLFSRLTWVHALVSTDKVSVHGGIRN